MIPQGPGRSSELLVEVVRILDKHKIEHAVIGAFAVAFYGIVRASLDVDALIAIQKNPAIVEELLRDFRGLGLTATFSDAEPDDPVRGVIAVADNFANRVDLILGIKDFDSAAFSRTKSINFLGQQIKVIAIEDLLVLKLLAGGPQDLDDIRGILKVSGSQIDLVSLRKRAEKSGASCTRLLDNILKSQ